MKDLSNPVRPEQISSISDEEYKQVDKIITIINDGLMKRKFTFNTGLDNLHYNMRVLLIATNIYEDVGWVVNIAEDEHNTYTIKFSK